MTLAHHKGRHEANSSHDRLPDFLIIGAMKAGTTTLHRHLSAHPGVFMPAVKEPEFFVAEKTWGRGLDWYARLFASAPPGAVLGEASTSYTKPLEFHGVPRRIRSVLPDARLVYLLRHPVDRIQSMYEHMVLTGREHRPIDEAVLQDERYISPSRYAQSLRMYLEHFPREQIHVALTDDLRDDPTETVREILRFIGAGPLRHPIRPVETLVTVDRRPDTRLKSWLRRFPDVAAGYDRLPDFVQRPGRHLATRSRGGPPARMSEAAREALRLCLLSDLDDLGILLGRRTDAWGLTSRIGP